MRRKRFAPLDSSWDSSLSRKALGPPPAPMHPQSTTSKCGAPPRDRINRIVIATEHRPCRDGGCVEQHPHKNDGSQIGDEKRSGERFGGMTAGKGVDLDARPAQPPQVEVAKR